MAVRYFIESIHGFLSLPFSLYLLAYNFYGDVSLWWYIARANNLFTLNIPENIQLRIPGSTQYAQGT